MELPTQCPICEAGGDDGFSIIAKDRVVAHQPIVGWTTKRADGSIHTSIEWGVSEPIWETAETEEYFCSVCGRELPEDMQAWLDKQLGTKRVNAREEN